MATLLRLPAVFDSYLGWVPSSLILADRLLPPISRPHHARGDDESKRTFQAQR